MSDRSSRSRAKGLSVLGDVANEAVEVLDLALSDQFLAVVGRDSRPSWMIVCKIAARAVEALDDEDVVLGLWQNRERLLDRAPARGPQPIGGAIRDVIEETLRMHLAAHLERRAEEFVVAPEDEVAA